MIGKILFIDDECQKLQSGKPHIITNTVSKLVKEGKLDYKQCEIAESFADAVKKVINVKNGSDYSWIFIDRNLEKFADIKNAKEESAAVEIEVDEIKIEFDNKFFESLVGFEGDYLYFLLRKNGVLLEKICFLTANDPNSNGENSGLKTSHLVFDKDIPQTIVKVSKESVQSSMGGNDDDENNTAADEIELYNLIANSLNVQISFRHEDFFGNQHIESIFKNTGLINKFKELLVKIERNEKPTYEEGTVLRNMLEIIVADITKDPNITVRNYLNLADAYSALFKRKHTAQNYIDISKQHSPVDENNVRNFLGTKLSGDKLEQEVQYVLQYATALRLNNLSDFYKGNIPNGCPPKYIFSCIDNIYTVTSEWSSHGKNLTTTKDLS